MRSSEIVQFRYVLNTNLQIPLAEVSPAASSIAVSGSAMSAHEYSTKSCLFYPGNFVHASRTHFVLSLCAGQAKYMLARYLKTFNSDELYQ